MMKNWLELKHCISINHQYHEAASNNYCIHSLHVELTICVKKKKLSSTWPDPAPSLISALVEVDLLVIELVVVDLLVGVLCADNKYTNSRSFSTFHATDVHLCDNHTFTYILVLYLCSS